MSKGFSGRAANGEMNRSQNEASVSGDEELENRLVDDVFGKPLLGDMIFRYALGYKVANDYNIEKVGYGYPEIDRQNLCNFRLVSKIWNEAVSEFLKNKREPLYVVKMTESNSRNEAPEVERSGKVLDNFLNFLNTREDQDSYAGFCLKMVAEVFGLENYEDILACLEPCAQHLVEMRLEVPENFPGTLPDTLKLPELQKLRLFLAGEILPKAAPTSVMPFIQSLLKKSSVLKHIHFDSEWILPEFQDANLPSSLVTLKLNNCENPQLLECLTRNHLPELKELTLNYIYDDVFPEEDLIFQVLDKLRHGLRVFRISEIVDSAVSPFKLRFPVMESLERLHLDGTSIQLTMATPTPSFPKLTHVKLDEFGVKQFISTIPSVTTVQIHIYLHEDDDFLLDLLKAVHRAFPNLTDLRLDEIDRMHSTDLQYLFREMRQLRRLSIKTVPEGGMSSDHWDAALIGAPVEFVRGLKACPREFWKDLKMDIQTGNSIKMLKELAYLRLYASRHNEPGPLISELAFIFALNEMTKLKHIKLEGRFSASKEIVEEWEAQGRKIEVR